MWTGIRLNTDIHTDIGCSWKYLFTKEFRFLHMFNILSSCPVADDAHSVELTQFKEQFKSHLGELVRHVSLKYKVLLLMQWHYYLVFLGFSVFNNQY